MTFDLLLLLFNRHSPFVGYVQKDNALGKHAAAFAVERRVARGRIHRHE